MRKLTPPRSSHQKKVVCTVSAAALMLGVSSAATVGLHFQENYCGSAAYSGFPVTMTAFGIAPSGWENLLPMSTGYGGCALAAPPYSFTLNETIDDTTSTNGLNPLPNGSLNVTWTANDANFSGFAGYGGSPPSYGYSGPPPKHIPTGEWQIYSTFLRDGVNFGIEPDGTEDYNNCGDNTQPQYLIDITGLHSLFTNGPFVIELIAASDSMQTLTNAFVIDVPGASTNSVTYPRTPVPYDQGGTCNQWLRGHGGGLSTASSPLNTDHVQITSNHPQHGGVGLPPTGFDNAGTISGFIVTDKPVFTMNPQQVATLIGDTVTLNPYVIGVPPLSLQWRFNGVPIAGETNMSITVANVSAATAGNYDLVASNAYGSATSASVIVGDLLQQVPAANIVLDSNPTNTPNNGFNMGATWEASSSDGTTTRTGVMSFNSALSNGISVDDSAAIDGTNGGTITFWMRTSGDSSANNASIICRPTGNNNGKEFSLTLEPGSPGNLEFADSFGSIDNFSSVAGVADNKWHFVALSFDPTANQNTTLYIDGAQDSSQANDPWSWPASQSLEIGYSTDPTYADYNGLLDDVRFYSTILTPTQITQVQSGAIADANDLQFQFNFTAAPGSGLTLSWQSSGAVLQSAPSVTGPWSNVTGAGSPFTIVPGPNSQFFRYQVSHTSQTVVSNPYLM